MYRKAVWDDCAEIYQLICEMENTQLPFDRFSAIYRAQLADVHYGHFVCVQDGHVAGVLNLRYEEQLHHCAFVAEILEFAVAGAYRGKGIGKELLACGCRAAQEFGCVQIEAACNQLRSRTHRFYEREGLRNFHFRFSKSLSGNDTEENAIGR